MSLIEIWEWNSREVKGRAESGFSPFAVIFGESISFIFVRDKVDRIPNDASVSKGQFSREREVS